MGLTKLPTRTDASVGRTKSDRLPVPNKDHFLSMGEVNETLDRLVEVCAAVGLADGSTVGSLEARMDASGRVLFKWNELDLTQFDAASLIATAGVDLTPAVTVVDSSISPGKKAISFKATGTLANGRNALMLMRILAAQFTCPASRRYVVRMRIGAHKTATANERTVIGPAFLSGTSGGNPYANLVGPLDDNATSAAWHWRYDGTVLASGGTTPSFFTPGVGDGAWMEFEIDGKEASPPVWRVTARGEGSGGGTKMGSMINDQADFGIAAAPAAWNALTLDRAGIALGINANGAGVTDPYYEITELTILKHPMDE